jgi:hypothetical protein
MLPPLLPQAASDRATSPSSRAIRAILELEYDPPPRERLRLKLLIRNVSQHIAA